MRDFEKHLRIKTLSTHSWQGVVPRGTLLGCALLAAFLVGNYLGHLHFGQSPAESAVLGSLSGAPEREQLSEAGLLQSPADPGVSGYPPPRTANEVARAAETADPSSPPASHLTLRLRSVARISSAEVQAGERITFVTEESFEDASGRKVPAGSRVEGVIAQSTAASGASGRLVIEIHSLHVGNRALALRALPVAALGAPLPAEQATHKAAQASSKRAKGPRSETLNPLERIPDWRTGKVGSRSPGSRLPADTTAPASASAPETGAEAREAVVPQEAILEFELLQLPLLPQEIVPGQTPDLGEPQHRKPPAPVEWRPKSRPRTAHG